jgi:two-component system OmpR family sensor kinase
VSIRLRLTLVYTAILALTLASLGGVLYGTQLQSMHLAEERGLNAIADRMVERLETGSPPPQDLRPLPPDERDERIGERRFGIPVTYWQISGVDGKTLGRSPNLEDVTLPLDDRARAAALEGERWSGPVRLGADRLLVLTAPIMVEGETSQIVTVAHSLSGQDEYLETMRRNLLVGSGVAVAVAFVCGWVLSGLVLRPVDQITRTAQAIGAERDFNRRVRYRGPEDEIGELATTFNAMLGELEEAYQQQQQFVADVSHELRTPLTTIRGNLELLRRHPPVSPEDREEVLDDMSSESERLIRLVNDLLRLARADARQSLRAEVIPIEHLIEDVCRQARLLDPQRSISCAAPPDVEALADRDGLKQVLLILVDNALKHTEGPVVVGAVAGDGRVRIRVEDAGPGIPPGELPHVFDRFYRGHASGSGHAEGLGLGLPIAKALIEAQGGAIEVRSDVSRGSRFAITLPLAGDLA